MFLPQLSEKKFWIYENKAKLQHALFGFFLIHSLDGFISIIIDISTLQRSEVNA